MTKIIGDKWNEISKLQLLPGIISAMLESIIITSIAVVVLVVGVLIIGRFSAVNATRALAKNPDNIKALQRVIRMMLARGEQEEALIRLEHLLKLQPENLDALLLLATIRYRRQEYELADPHFKKLFDEELLSDKKAKRLFVSNNDFIDVLTMAYYFQGHRLHIAGRDEAAAVFKKKAQKYSKKLVRELALY